MRNKSKTVGILLAAAFFVGVIAPIKPSVTTATGSGETPDGVPTATMTSSETSGSEPTAAPLPSETPDAEPTKTPAEDSGQKDESTFMGQYYVAKGQPCAFQDPQKGTIKVISSAGNQCKVSGNKLTVTCKKTGFITYKIKNEERQIRIFVGGNSKDSKVNKKEYNLPVDYDGKSYTNFIDALRAKKKKDKNNMNDVSILLSSKKKLKSRAKYNRGIKYGSTIAQVENKYPSWEDVGTYENDSCCYAARYYDKKTNYVAVKGFILDKRNKVKKIVYIAYPNSILKLNAV